jgi:hypothetical protein
VRAWLLGAVLLGLAACYGPVEDGRPCDDAGACLPGFVCVDAVCVPGVAAGDAGDDAGDDGGLADAGDDAGLDAGSRRDGGVDAGPGDAGPPVVCPSDGGVFDREWTHWRAQPPAPEGTNYRATPSGNSVIDRVTGLQWQRFPPMTATGWADAGADCANLMLDGHHDWRLPTLAELSSLVDFTVIFNTAHAVPTLNASAFPTALPSVVWTSTVYSGDPTWAYTVSFAGGDVIPYAQTIGSPKVLERCVRSYCGSSFDLADAGAPVGRFAVLDGGLVVDEVSGLTWEQDFQTNMVLTDALLACADAGARVPTVRELLTLFDPRAKLPGVLIDPVFGASQSQVLMTVSPDLGNSGGATSNWLVDFKGGRTSPFDATGTNRRAFRCVR